MNNFVTLNTLNTTNTLVTLNTLNINRENKNIQKNETLHIKPSALSVLSGLKASLGVKIKTKGRYQ